MLLIQKKVLFSDYFLLFSHSAKQQLDRILHFRRIFQRKLHLCPGFCRHIGSVDHLQNRAAVLPRSLPASCLLSHRKQMRQLLGIALIEGFLKICQYFLCIFTTKGKAGKPLKRVSSLRFSIL